MFLASHGLGDAHEETVTLKEVFGPNVNAVAVTDSDSEESDEFDANLNNDIPNRRTPHVTQKAQKVFDLNRERHQ